MKEFISYLSSAVLGETMGSSAKESKASKLTAIPGVGAATAKKLIDAKLDTVSKVATAGAANLVKAGIQAALAKKVASAAKKLDKASTATKKTAAAAKKAAKTAPAKAKAAAKKAPAKAKATASKAKAATQTAAKKTTDKAKNLAAKAKTKAKPKSDSGTKGGKIGPSPDTPLSKLAWFRNAKKSRELFKDLVFYFGLMPRRKYGRLRKTVELPPVRKLSTLSVGKVLSDSGTLRPSSKTTS